MALKKGDAMVHTLTEFEKKMAMMLGQSRINNSADWGLTNGKISHRSQKSIDYDGAAAEILAARLLNVYPDFTTQELHHDLLFHGYTIDVKCTNYERGRLLATTNKAVKPCDYYILMIGSDFKFRCAGVASGKDLFRDEKIMQIKTPVYAMEQEELIPLERWMNKI